METTTKKILTHVWQDAGLGRAPFQYVTTISIPGPGLLEANPDAYNNAMRACQQAASKFGVHIGMCNYCGMDLMNNYVIRDADAKHFVVGCDCAMKTGDSKLMTAVEIAKRDHERKLRRARQQAEWEQQRVARAAELEAERERNGGKTDGELEAEREEAEKKARILAIRNQNQPIIALLEAHSKCEGDFCFNIARELRTQRFTSLSSRVQDIVQDIWIKDATKGKKGKERGLVESLAYTDFSVITGQISPELGAYNTKQHLLSAEGLPEEEYLARRQELSAELEDLLARGLGIADWQKAHGLV